VQCGADSRDCMGRKQDFARRTRGLALIACQALGDFSEVLANEGLGEAEDAFDLGTESLIRRTLGEASTEPL